MRLRGGIVGILKVSVHWRFLLMLNRLEGMSFLDFVDLLEA